MLQVKEKIAYGLGDTASNIVFQTVMLFLAFFYTDIFGLSPAIVGTLFLSIRVLDAITDPLMGALTDRTRSKHGHFRPYILWLAIPFGAISVITFTTPDLGDTGKVIYAFATYALLMIAYTAINIPYSALGGALTPNPEERVTVQSYRFTFGMLGGLLVSALTIPLVDWLGKGDKALGYQLTMVIMSIAGVVMFFICFYGTKERVEMPQTNGRPLKADLQLLWRNDQWRVLCAAAFVLLVGMVLRNTLAIYYVKYYLEQESMITQFITLGMIGNILGCVVSAYAAKRICRIKLYRLLQVIAGVISAASVLVDSSSLILAFVMHFLWGFFLQMATPLLWAKMADVVDYGHVKTGERLTGVVYSTIVFFIKLGLALGGAIAGWLLAFYGYEADQAQSETVKQGILWSFTVFPALCFFVVAFLMKGYTLNNTKVSELQQSLQTN
ncbi:glycoside-pentoside-hexuronide (GPH):cation symporter [Alteromonas sp. a30]|uniref:glycoside-pentoside-hexuronide (GPH):cation symporter n=1 Tax=Alteromonas sp. a30 TaxID=2730917 RepID=UPI0022801278|nr:glycoside-pentoside-hexuronide (GPH):cation symporter [Alteromonas sp. a30]MCY7294038.1 MFS transporter [Alteromonas sp. a30]